MFASRSLAARIEACEARLSMSVTRSARPDDPARSARPIAGGIAAFVRPGSINKVAGVGFAGVPDDETLAPIEDLWWSRGEAVRFEVSTLADPAVFSTLTARGYQLREFENVLGLALPSAVAVAAEVQVAALGDGGFEAWYDAMLTGFATPDGSDQTAALPREVLAGLFDDFLRSDEQRRYLATVDGAPAGAAAVRFDDGIAQLCGATTLPHLRRRGVQRAMLAQRLLDAAAAGCELAVVTTAPGSQSQANVARIGFELLYARAVLVRPPPPVL